MSKRYMFKAGMIQLLMAAALFGCGQNSSPPPPVAPVVAPVAAIAGGCQVGMVYSASYGCLPQGSCPIGMAMYGSQCVPATGGIGIAGNQCTVGAVYNAPGGGCYQQGACPAGYVMCGTQCTVATAVGTSAGLCSPYGTTGYNPYGTTGYNPYGTTAYNPYGTTGYSPYGSAGIYGYPYGGTGYNPYTAYSPYTAAYNPYGTGGGACPIGHTYYPGYGCI